MIKHFASHRELNENTALMPVSEYEATGNSWLA